MFTREKWECFNALEYYINQQGIDLDKFTDDDIEMDESAKIYVFLGANIEGVEIVKGNVRYFVPLLEYNSEVDEYLQNLEKDRSKSQKQSLLLTVCRPLAELRSKPMI